MMTQFTRLNVFLANAPRVPMLDLDYRHLSRAEQLSRTSQREIQRVGSVIACRREIFGEGFNSRKTHPYQARWNKFSNCLHAEIVALLETQKRKDFQPERATVYVSRYGRRGTLGCSYPCDGCWSALNHVGVRSIVCYDESATPIKIKV